MKRRALEGVILISLSLLLLAPASPLRGDDGPGFFGLGGHASLYETGDADNGRLFGGLQARLRLSDGLTLEASADYRKEEFEDGLVEVEGYPLQLSALFYILKGSQIGPHLLGGVTWYSSDVTVQAQGPGGVRRHYDSDEFGYHGGFGLDIELSDNVFLHGDVRYLFLDVELEDLDVSHDGLIVQAGLTYYF